MGDVAGGFDVDRHGGSVPFVLWFVRGLAVRARARKHVAAVDLDHPAQHERVEDVPQEMRAEREDGAERLVERAEGERQDQQAGTVPGRARWRGRGRAAASA